MNIAIVLAVDAAIFALIVYIFVTKSKDSSGDLGGAASTAKSEPRPPAHGSGTSTSSETEESGRVLAKEATVILMFFGFILGFVAAFGLEYLLLVALHARPRGIAWVIIPVLVGISLARLAPHMAARASTSGASLWRSSQSFRLIGVLSALWLLAVPAYWWLFGPYDSYRMHSDDYALMFKVMIFPIIVLVLAYVAYTKLVATTPPPPQGK